MSKDNPSIEPHIVSSEHLAEGEEWPLSEFEYGMIMAYNAFSRWMIKCIGSVGFKDFNPLDVLVLHNVNHKNRDKRLVDIAFVLNIDDIHTVNYSLKKLVKLQLVESSKIGKEMYYSTTSKGKKACNEYQKIRKICLLPSASAKDDNFEEYKKAALFLRNISGLYDQASRSAASL